MSRKRTDVEIFIGFFVRYVGYVWHVIVALIALMVVGGVLISYLEGLELGESIYFAFITGLTIGYGDIEPVTPSGRLVSILIGMVGLLFTGIVVAIATRALADMAKQILDHSS